MSSRRLRQVAALTLAFVAAPFLAATAVAAQAAPTAKAPGAAVAASTTTTVTWPTRVAGVVERHSLLAPPAPPALVAPVRAVAPPPPPPPPSVDDPGTWLWPGNGPVTSPFGRRWGRMHEGVDIDAAYGSTVVAAHRGTVILAGWGQSGYGKTVEIDHGNGLVTRYAHLSSISVASGQVIERGTPIGAVGASGSVTAAHLHYEVREHGVPRNPANWLPAGGASKSGNPG
ncbi:MAG TPA: M23 family metallopeptidase [Acidimicrobiales bacterium]|nr:M23 family metallopeptidase [Acidimicrobiales bacterium]